MIYQVIHTTNYRYTEPVSLCQNIARLIPRNTERQLCKKSIITIDPLPEVREEYEDFFGNKLLYFAIQEEHLNLIVTVSSQIEKLANQYQEISLYHSVSWQEVKEMSRKSTPSWLDVHQFIPETALTTSSPEIKNYAMQSYSGGRSMFDATHHLMRRIYEDFEFKPGFTTVSTPLSVVMKARKGVCQDFAHLAIACVRAMGLPARYVSGYLETVPPPGKEKLAGADASHAWFSVYIPHMGWVDFDPTNNQLPSSQHLTVCWGRDYADIAPLKGVIVNSGPHQMSVSVDVKRIA